MVKMAKLNYIKLLSDGLSIVTIAICFILKVPQILKLLKVKHARGINVFGLVMELTSYTIMMSYNFRNGYAILSYLEYPIILVQELILIYLVLKYKSLLSSKYVWLAALAYFSALGGFLIGIVPLGLLAFLVPLCTPIGASSKVVQLAEILRTKNSQSVSILTWFISAFTNFTRVFTIIMESADLTLLLNFTINTVLSSLVMIVAIVYKNPSKPAILKKSE